MEQRLKKIFADSLNIAIERVTDDLTYNSIPEWDSVGHMHLISALDEELDTMIETVDIVGMRNFKAAKEILKKYGMKFD